MINTWHPDTAPEVRKALIRAFVHKIVVRLVYGDTKTGIVRFSEDGLVGRVGHTVGTRQIPLVIEPLLKLPGGEVVFADGGPALLEHDVLRVLDCYTGEELYRHELYKCPQLFVQRHYDANDPDPLVMWKQGFRWEVRRERVGEPLIHTKTYEEATEYVAFMQGHKTHRAFRTIEEYRKDFINE